MTNKYMNIKKYVIIYLLLREENYTPYDYLNVHLLST